MVFKKSRPFFQGIEKVVKSRNKKFSSFWLEIEKTPLVVGVQELGE